ncbi:MAG: hypothetical protein AAF434_19830 [Pseudomonadota bacterium]
MSKSKKRSKSKSRHLSKTSNTPVVKKGSRSKPNNIVVVVASIIVFLGMSAAGLAAYKKSWEKEHDLSVIGNGKITVVQIHDPGCRLCQRLQKNTKTALRGLNDDIQYRVANINTSKGKAFQIRHKEQHVTLLLFDGRGSLKRTIRGVQEADELRRIFTQEMG